MAINADFPVFHVPETSPWLSGLALGQQLMQNALMSPKELLAKELANRQADLMNQVKGVEAKYAEPFSQEALKKEQLINQFYGPNIQSEIASRQASTDLSRLNAEKTRMLMEQLKNASMGQADTSTPLARTGISDFDRLPVAQKNYLLGKAATIGVSPEEAADWFRQRKTFSQLAASKGLSEDQIAQVQPTTLPTAATTTQLQRMNMATAANDVFDPVITKGLGNYSGQFTFKGTPIGFYKDALSGSNKDKQAEFIAASVLAQDELLGRAKQIGAPLGIGILNHMLTTSLGDVSGKYQVTDPAVLNKSRQIIKKSFEDSVHAQNKSLMPGFNQERLKSNKTSLTPESISGMSTDQIKQLLGSE